MANKYHQGKFTPKHPEKYVGDVTDIVFRSSWENKFMLWADSNPGVVYWNSESVIVPYYNPVKQRMARYFVDFAVMVKSRSGKTKKYLVEIKPRKERSAPTGTKKTKRLLEQTMTYATNQAKWDAAKVWAEKNHMEFIVLDEYDLGIK